MVLCMRWVDENLIPHEEFIGLHAIPDTSVDEIVAIIKDILLRMNLRIENANGQCYDGASSMSGKRSGVATQIKSLNRKCLYPQLWSCSKSGCRGCFQNNSKSGKHLCYCS